MVRVVGRVQVAVQVKTRLPFSDDVFVTVKLAAPADVFVNTELPVWAFAVSAILAGLGPVPVPLVSAKDAVRDPPVLAVTLMVTTSPPSKLLTAKESKAVPLLTVSELNALVWGAVVQLRVMFAACAGAARPAMAKKNSQTVVVSSSGRQLVLR